MERVIAGGNLQGLLAGFYSGALEHAFAKSTRSSQKSAVNAWRAFCMICSINWTLNGISLDEVTDIVLSYVGFEVGIREMSPLSIKGSYLSHINNYFITARLKNEFGTAVKSSIVQLILRGYERIYHLMFPIDGSRKFAFTIELVLHLKAALNKFKPEWLLVDHLVEMLELAMEFGIYFLLRKSEYLPCGKAMPNGLQWKSIAFFDEEGNAIAWSSIRMKRIKTIQIKIKSSKTDQHGIGRIRTHHRVEGDHCIVKQVTRWAIRCRDQYDMDTEDFLFRKEGHEPFLKDSTVSKAMKYIVRSLGWNDRKVSPHSLRYGGATMLAAAGLPQYVIEYFGGWAAGSQSLRVYAQQLGREAVLQVSKIMAAGFDMSLEESRIRAFANAL